MRRKVSIEEELIDNRDECHKEIAILAVVQGVHQLLDRRHVIYHLRLTNVRVALILCSKLR